MNFKLTHPLPERCFVAVSGGVDSISALHFLSQVEGRVVGVIHINHATGLFADEAEKLVHKVCEEQKFDLIVRTIQTERDEKESLEDFWRTQRYHFFREEGDALPIVLAHNMDDCLEEYIICVMLRGYLGTIPYQHDRCIRPFRLWRRIDIHRYALGHKLRWIEDPSNTDGSKFLRAKIRRQLAPRVRFVNPGIYSVVEKAVREQDKWDKENSEAKWNF